MHGRTLTEILLSVFVRAVFVRVRDEQFQFCRLTAAAFANRRAVNLVLH